MFISISITSLVIYVTPLVASLGSPIFTKMNTQATKQTVLVKTLTGAFIALFVQVPPVGIGAC